MGSKQGGDGNHKIPQCEKGKCSQVLARWTMTTKLGLLSSARMCHGMLSDRITLLADASRDVGLGRPQSRFLPRVSQAT